MKGIILAGGNATRLFPLTHTTCKQLLPVYNKQMIFYPLNTLIKAGIKDILIIVNPETAGQFISLLGPVFEHTDISVQFKVQTVPRGLADAFIIGEKFIDNDDVALILGDNIFEDNFYEDVARFRSSIGGCRIFLKYVQNPKRYGVAVIDTNNTITNIVEKPTTNISHYAVVGFYLFDKNIIKIAKSLSPSNRGELEITEAIRSYLILTGQCKHKVIEGAWFDAGTYEDYLFAGAEVFWHKQLREFCPEIEDGITRYNDHRKEILKKQLG